MGNAVDPPEMLGFSAERLARIGPAMRAYVDAGKFAGISTLIARRGRVVHFEQVGSQDREAGIPLAPDTIYRIYSMTKPVVCVALMALFEQGRVRLTDPVAKFLPRFGAVRVSTGTGQDRREVELARPITVRDLLTHTAGLTYDWLDDSPVCELYREAGVLAAPARSLESMIAELARLPLAFQPGTRWHYSVGIDVAAHLVEIISGRPLQDFLREHLFGPLGMPDTGFSVPPAERHRLAAMYGLPDIAANSFRAVVEAWRAGFNERLDVEATYPSGNPGFARGGHGLFSTAGDYLRFAQMLLNRGELDGARILAPKTCDLMHANHVPSALLPYEIGGMPSPGYGFGLGSRVLLNVAESALPGSVGEFGWAGAATTYYWVDPREELVGVLMAQSMLSFEPLRPDFRTLAYAALVG